MKKSNERNEAVASFLSNQVCVKNAREVVYGFTPPGWVA